MQITFEDGKSVDFGATGYSDYTITGSDLKKKAYIARHKQREVWTKAGIRTAGFWARWLLWNKPTILQSINDIEKRFNVTIKANKYMSL